MTVGDIIKKVRLSIDEESGYADLENTRMDNIIKAKIGDALRWCCLYAEGSLLNSAKPTTGTDGGIIRDYTITDGSPDSSDIGYSNGIVTLPSGYMKLVRVKADGWHKAVANAIEEDSEQYLMQNDKTAKATVERPVVAIIEKRQRQLELFPKPETTGKIELTVVVEPTVEGSDSWSQSTELDVPSKIEGGFVYYLAFLVLSAYNDISKANQMLAIAKMGLGVTGNQ